MFASMCVLILTALRPLGKQKCVCVSNMHTYIRMCVFPHYSLDLTIVVIVSLRLSVDLFRPKSKRYVSRGSSHSWAFEMFILRVLFFVVVGPFVR